MVPRVITHIYFKKKINIKTKTKKKGRHSYFFMDP
jgi:hypothetical protein